jgi:nucleoside-diphosphate-sugar epimerase
MKNIDFLVTGATGWLGRRVVRALIEGQTEMGKAGGGGHKVRMLVAPGEDASDLISLGAEAVTGDIRDPAAARALTVNAQGAVLLQLAGVIHPSDGVKDFMAVNFGGTRNIVEAAGAAGVRRVVAMSSNSPIGASRNPVEVFDEGSPYRPYMGYGRSKFAMEQWLLNRIATGTGPEITIIRAPWFYGPEQPARQTQFFTMIRDGKFPLMGRGENRRSLGYVDSLAYGILLAAGAPIAAGRIYWLADERAYPMREIVDTVRAVLREDFGITVKPATVHAPAIVSDLARIADGALQAAGLYHQKIHVLSEMNLTIACNIERAKRELGYHPLTDLRVGMRRSVAWLLHHGRKI